MANPHVRRRRPCDIASPRRLFRLTVGIVLAVEVLVFVPELAHERMNG